MCAPGMAEGGPSTGPVTDISPLPANAVKGVARQCRCGPVRPYAVIAHTTASCAAQSSVGPGDNPTTARPGREVTSTASALAPIRRRNGSASVLIQSTDTERLVCCRYW